jgi:ribosomal protein S27E
LKAERRRTLGDWVAICPGCGHGQRYFAEAAGDLAPACPTCGTALLAACPACRARIASMFAVACEECGTPLREPSQFGTAIRRERPR